MAAAVAAAIHTCSRPAGVDIVDPMGRQPLLELGTAAAAHAPIPTRFPHPPKGRGSDPPSPKRAADPIGTGPVRFSVEQAKPRAAPTAVAIAAKFFSRARSDRSRSFAPPLTRCIEVDVERKSQ